MIFTFFYFFIDFDAYYIVKTDEGQPRPKFIFNKCGTNIYFFTLQRFGPSPSPNFKEYHTSIYDKMSLNIIKCQKSKKNNKVIAISGKPYKT